MPINIKILNSNPLIIYFKWDTNFNTYCEEGKNYETSKKFL